MSTPNHQQWHAKWKLSKNTYLHIAQTFFCVFGTDLHAQAAFIDKISASELRQKLINNVLLGWESYA